MQIWKRERGKNLNIQWREKFIAMAKANIFLAAVTFYRHMFSLYFEFNYLNNFKLPSEGWKRKGLLRTNQIVGQLGHNNARQCETNWPNNHWTQNIVEKKSHKFTTFLKTLSFSFNGNKQLEKVHLSVLSSNTINYIIRLLLGSVECGQSHLKWNEVREKGKILIILWN